MSSDVLAAHDRVAFTALLGQAFEAEPWVADAVWERAPFASLDELVDLEAAPSAFLAGLGGGLFAIAHGFVSLDTVHWTTSGEAVIVVVLGGIGTLWGGVIGSVLLVWLEDRLSVAGFTLVGLITGSIFVVVVLAFRRGIWGTVRALFHRERDGRR